MEIKSILKKLEQSQEYKGWKKMHAQSFFSYALKTMDPNGEGPWQLGFYNPKTDKMVTFVMHEPIEMQPEEEIVKQPDSIIEPIELEAVKLSFEKIIDSSLNFLSKHYPKEDIIKKITILQNIKPFDTIWNLTYVSQNYNTLHIKIDPTSGKVLKHSCESLMNFMKSSIKQN